MPDLPRIWNERMTSYLGCTPKDDAQGVLQVSTFPANDFLRPLPQRSSCKQSSELLRGPGKAG